MRENTPGPLSMLMSSSRWERGGRTNNEQTHQQPRSPETLSEPVFPHTEIIKLEPWVQSALPWRCSWRVGMRKSRALNTLRELHRWLIWSLNQVYRLGPAGQENICTSTLHFSTNVHVSFCSLCGLKHQSCLVLSHCFSIKVLCLL